MPYWKLYYHFVWGMKNRLPLIGSSLEPELYRAIAAKVQALDGFVHAIGGMEGHAHLAVSIPPKLAPAKFIGNVKGNSSHYVNHVIKLGLIGRNPCSGTIPPKPEQSEMMFYDDEQVRCLLKTAQEIGDKL